MPTWAIGEVGCFVFVRRTGPIVLDGLRGPVEVVELRARHDAGGRKFTVTTWQSFPSKTVLERAVNNTNWRQIRALLPALFPQSNTATVQRRESSGPNKA